MTQFPESTSNEQSTVLEEYATRMIAAEAMHVSEKQLMLMRSAPQ